MSQLTIFETLLSKRIPMPPDLPITFLEVAQMPHYEVVVSRIYQFYLQDSQEHGFKDLFLRSLINLINKKWSTKTGLGTSVIPDFPANWEVQVEVATPKGNRIDLLIEWEDSSCQKYSIIIENKIFHVLRNDLEDYFMTPQTPDENKFGVLLTLQRQDSNHERFLNITHEEWVEEVKSALGAYMIDGIDRHLFFIRDFILNLTKLTKSRKYMSEFSQFYFSNRAQIENLVHARNQFVEEVFNAFRVAGGLLQLETGGVRAQNYQYLIIEKKTKLLTLVYNPMHQAPFALVYEIQGDKLLHKERYRESAKELIQQQQWSAWEVTNWNNANSAHIVAKSCGTLGDGTQSFLDFFENEIKEFWLPFVAEFSAKTSNI